MLLGSTPHIGVGGLGVPLHPLPWVPISIYVSIAVLGVSNITNQGEG